MTQNRLLKLGLAVVLAAILVGGAAVVVRQTIFPPKTITAYFTTATAIYPGDEVRIAGVKVGTIDSIDPVGTQAKMTMHVDRGIRRTRRCQGGDRRPEPRLGALCPARARLRIGPDDE